MESSKPTQNAKHAESSNGAANDMRSLAQTVGDSLKEYARENPGAAALWCLGIGFVLGWKLKPW
jgi:hypothetical protein